MSLVTTDLNNRERARFAGSLDLVAKEANKLAASLRAGDDSEALIHLVTLSIATLRLDELRDAFEQALIVAKTKTPDDASALPENTPAEESPS